VQLRVDRFTVAIFLLTALIAVLLYTILTIPDPTPTPQLPPQLDEVVSATTEESTITIMVEYGAKLES